MKSLTEQKKTSQRGRVSATDGNEQVNNMNNCDQNQNMSKICESPLLSNLLRQLPVGQIRPPKRDVCPCHPSRGEQTLVWDAGKGTYVCDKCLQEESDRETAKWVSEDCARIVENDLRRKIAATGMGRRYYDASFDSFDPIRAGRQHFGRAITVLHKVREWSENSVRNDTLEKPFLVLHGTTGTGKSHLLSACVHAFVNAKKEVRYYNASDLIKAVRDTWSSSHFKTIDESEYTFLRRLSDVDVLVIDEFGTGLKWSDDVQNTISEILMSRYQQNLPTLIGTNLRLSDKTAENELAAFVGSPVYSRFAEVALMLEMVWDDYRFQN